jgi:CHC2 zinc finger/Toprim-like
MQSSKLFSTTARGDRIDWPDIKDRIDLGIVATNLMGPAPGRRGERGRRLWWNCPFHQDANPSFAVDPRRQSWRCFGCSEHGDAASLAMRLRGLAFPEAIRWLAELAGIVAPSGKPIRPRPPIASPAKAPERPPDPPSGLPLADALSLIADASERLWTPEGSTARAYLKDRRGLTEGTIKAARLGWVRSVELPTRDGDRFWPASGVTIPWWDHGRLALLKIRQPEGSTPKYAQAFGDRPALYPTPEAVRPGKPLVVTEGEFDALLLGQALGDLAAVVTLGSASARPEAAILGKMLPAPAWYIATDADTAGDQAASGWPARAIRVRPPAPCKDWTEAFLYPINLRRWWTDRLGGIENPVRSTWDELAQRRWGPALNDPTPGNIIDWPAGRPVVILDDPEERAAIQREGCP